MKKAAKWMGIVLAAVVLCWGVAVGWYYPRYLERKKPVTLTPEQGSISVMSCNLRCLSPLDLGKRSWFYRADLLTQDIAGENPGIIGFQEATRWQYTYMTQVLTGYDSVIQYRDNSPISEGCPIFYHTGLYTLVDSGSFWLSETSEVMSKDWGSECYRICSYVILTDKATGKDFVVFNTHLDHVSDEARIKGIGVVLEKIAQFGGLPAVIMGDLNATEDSQTYRRATEQFTDAGYAAEEGQISHTYQNWGNPDAYRRLDYFLITPGAFRVLEHDVIQPVHDGVYASDHCPIVVRMVFD